MLTLVNTLDTNFVVGLFGQALSLLFVRADLIYVHNAEPFLCGVAF